MTTYVLGAGASFHVGYPLASTLERSCLTRQTRMRPSRYALEAKALLFVTNLLPMASRGLRRSETVYLRNSWTGGPPDKWEVNSGCPIPPLGKMGLGFLFDLNLQLKTEYLAGC